MLLASKWLPLGQPSRLTPEPLCPHAHFTFLPVPLQWTPQQTLGQQILNRSNYLAFHLFHPGVPRSIQPTVLYNLRAQTRDPIRPFSLHLIKIIHLSSLHVPPSLGSVIFSCPVASLSRQALVISLMDYELSLFCSFPVYSPSHSHQLFPKHSPDHITSMVKIFHGSPSSLLQSSRPSLCLLS